MMTCRLLCALLVLALCCCPSVCVTATGEKQEGANGSTAAQPPEVGVPGPNGTAPLSQPSTVQTQGEILTSQGSSAGADTGRSTGEAADTPENSGPTIPVSDTEQGQDGSGGSGSSDTTSSESIPIQEQQPSGSNSPAAASSSVTAPVSAQSEKENAPTTTTTTTNTTKAPTATTTTTTEAPTTTTTRAPSLLRESDGSLSSSAWVCAPLLLAVSALAYTTLG
ncbi:putative mucin TcMUCII [Trypanosoma cruzi]|uniref:Mucin TcMUCII, putative n=2 Tax=Trypanosoma cruzi TaxID=5693 RepID=Q4DGH3_TRYCC|nr:mucin TcMUCII, putative [Trypanosoma cruzi]EAN91626.1 mucin TcMUCII, putative [Trypanosoma cruzi]PWV14692.1 putative mucin TcMUCII [Trypanosoma cruzi]RNC39375.1 mucin TcMUCII [Trypanosoma cruzi]|eukprot:XP_813477.1 mucin TcMUCII [Trypanosoma cruzi strain CL Brener]